MLENKIIEPYGWCFGVEKAITDFINIINTNRDKKIYVIGTIIHNQITINSITKNNVFFLKPKVSFKKIKKLEKQSVIIFSAHGCDEKVKEFCFNNFGNIYDLTCPVILKNIELIKKLDSENKKILYFGKKQHEETFCVLSQTKNIKLITKLKKINKIDHPSTLINQTTILLDPPINKNIQFINTTCTEVLQRINNIKNINDKEKTLIVVGDKKSNNTKQLVNFAKKQKLKTKLISNVKQLKHIKNTNYLITSGTSTSKKQVIEVKSYLEESIG